jgi:hypothetical protein
MRRFFWNVNLYIKLLKEAVTRKQRLTESYPLIVVFCCKMCLEWRSKPTASMAKQSRAHSPNSRSRVYLGMASPDARRAKRRQNCNCYYLFNLYKIVGQFKDTKTIDSASVTIYYRYIQGLYMCIFRYR